MSPLELTRRAVALLAASSMEMDWYAREAEIGTLVDNAMQELAETVASDDLRKGLLMQEYTVTLTDGTGEMLNVLGARTNQADILWQSIPRGIVTDADGGLLHYVSDLYDFRRPLLNGFNYYHITGNGRMLARAGGADYVPGNLPDPLTVTANFIPVPDNLPAQLEDEAVETLARVAVRKLAA